MPHILNANQAPKVGNDLVKPLLVMLSLLTVIGNPVEGKYRTIQVLESTRSLGAGELASYLNGSDRALAARAALAIGRTKQPAGVSLLTPHLAEANSGLRAMVVYALGLIGTGEGAPQITLTLARDPSATVRIAALDALGRFEVAKVLAPPAEANASRGIVASLHGDDNATVRARAATALEAFHNGVTGNFVSRELVKAIKAERDANVRWHIMWSIFRGYATRVPRSVLTGGLHDKDETVRIEAVRAYGRLKNRNAIPALQPLTRDSSWRVQEQALESINTLSGKPPTQHLTSIAPGVHTPPVRSQTFTEIVPLPRPSVTGKPMRPDATQVRAELKLNPASAAFMSGPMPGPHPAVRVKTTKGAFVLKLYPEWAPLTVANFLSLTNRGYYDGLRWFRIVPDFVVQTGDPNDNGEGDAGYTIPAEENPLEQGSGVLSMGLNYDGNHPLRDSAGTQFYITLSPQLHLNRDFTVFGQVTSGFDVLGRLVESDRMTRVEQIPDTNE